MIPNPYIEIHTTIEERPSVPAWFAEVVMVAGVLSFPLCRCVSCRWHR